MNIRYTVRQFALAALLLGCGTPSFAALSLQCENQNLQACVDKAETSGGGTVYLGPATYYLEHSLLLKSRVNIEGKGPQSVITWKNDVAQTINEPLIYSESVSDVALKNFKLVGTVNQKADSQDLRNNMIGLFLNCPGDPTAGQKTGCSNLTLDKLEVENSSDGIHLKGVSHVTAIDLKLHNNGNTQKDYFHNIYLRRVADLKMIQTSKESGGFYSSPRGHGIRGSHLVNIYLGNLEVHDNADHGIHMDNVRDVRFHNLHVYHNCLNSTNRCEEIKCYGPECGINYNAPAE